MEDIRSYNIGNSDYAIHKFQVWDLWIEYRLNAFDGDLLKRLLRKKKVDGRKLDLEKIKHICLERVRQIKEFNKDWVVYEKINPKHSLEDIIKEYNLSHSEGLIAMLILIPSDNRENDYLRIIELIDEMLKEY